METRKSPLKSQYGRDIQTILKRSGLRLTVFSSNYKIPLRTLEDWVAGKRPIKQYVLDLLDFKVDYDLTHKS